MCKSLIFPEYDCSKGICRRLYCTVHGPLQQIVLLWIMGESAGKGLWLLALVTGGRWHLTCDTSHVTCHTWHVTRDTWHMIFFLSKKCQKSHKNCQKKSTQKILKSAKKCRKVSKRRVFIVSVLLSEHDERVDVSRMRDFYSKDLETTHKWCGDT